jgi:putative ABC transport system ATP-binding protein
MDLLFTLKERTGATLLLITHDRNLAKRCDRIVSLADGRIVSGGLKRKVAAS